MAIATALFVLHAPICALACLPSTVALPVDAAKHGDPPCHEDTSSSTPSVPAHSHDVCGCEDSCTALVPSTDPTLSVIPQLLPSLPSFSQALLTGFHRVPRSLPKETDLPPPDVLLLKSTLLI